MPLPSFIGYLLNKNNPVLGQYPMFIPQFLKHPVLLDQKSATIVHITPIGTQPEYGPAPRHLGTQETGAPGVHLMSYRDINNDEQFVKSIQCVRPTIILKNTEENTQLIIHAFNEGVTTNNKTALKVITHTQNQCNAHNVDFHINFKLDPQNVIDHEELRNAIYIISKKLNIKDEILFQKENPIFSAIEAFFDKPFENLPETNTNKKLTELLGSTFHSLNKKKDPDKLIYTLVHKSQTQIVQALETDKVIPKLVPIYREIDLKQRIAVNLIKKLV